MNEVEKPNFSKQVDALHRFIAKGVPIEFPVTNHFTPGLYAREIFMPKGSLLISKIHKTEHPYVVLTGKAVVWTESGGMVHLAAGHVGITQPGTRRVLYILEDCRWITFHATTETNVDKIEAQIIEPHELAVDEKDDESLLRLFGDKICLGQPLAQ